MRIFTHQTKAAMPTLKIDNSRIMDSHERAYLKVTSPTGKSLYIYKTKLTNKTPKALTDVFWKFCPDMMVRFVGDMEATREEMQKLLELSKLKP
jgi:hypothetical protein